MPDAVLGPVAPLVDVAADHAVEVPPPDHEPHRDAALVDALGVVGDPGDGVGDARVDAEGAEEGAGVLDPGAGGGEEHREADGAQDGGGDVAEPALAGAVGDVADGDGQDAGRGVGGHGEELGFDGLGVAELFGVELGQVSMCARFFD